MNFIKKIFDGKSDDYVHVQFQKFSRGNFSNRALIDAKKTKDSYIIKTSPEFANELVRNVAERLGKDRAKITGAIVSTLDLKNEIKFKEIKQFQGVKRYIVDTDMSGDEIISLLNKFPKNFFALSFSAGDSDLKIKAKAPKSGKSGKGEERPKADFCILKTKDKGLAKEFIFDVPEFKKAEITHDFIVESIDVPEELKNSKDFLKVREESKRVGKILRKSLIDGKELFNEKNFSA